MVAVLVIFFLSQFGCLFCMALLGGILYRTDWGRARVSNVRARVVLVDNSGLDFSAVGGRLGLHQPLDFVVVKHRAQQQNH